MDMVVPVRGNASNLNTGITDTVAAFMSVMLIPRTLRMMYESVGDMM